MWQGKGCVHMCVVTWVSGTAAGVLQSSRRWRIPRPKHGYSTAPLYVHASHFPHTIPHFPHPLQEIHQERKVPLRTAAFIKALQRVTRAEIHRGFD